MRRTFLVGAGVGAALMYFFDPSWGRRRRAQLRERVESGSRQFDAWRERSELRRVQGQGNGRSAGVREESEIDWSEGEEYGHTAARTRGR